MPGEGFLDPGFGFGAGLGGHDGLLGQGGEIVDGKSLPGLQLGPRRAHQHQRPAQPFAVARQRLFLQRQHRLQRIGRGQKRGDPGQGQAQAFQRQDLVQPRDLIGTVGAPAGLRAQRLKQTAALVQAQRLDADAEALGGLAGTEMEVSWDMSDSSIDIRCRAGGPEGPVQGAIKAQPGHPSDFRISNIMGNYMAIMYLP